MKIKYILLLISALFYSCNQSDVGIFYGLENEVKITDNSLSNNLSIGSMARNGTVLYIAAGRVYTKTSGSSADWRKVSTPSGYDLSTSLASDGSDVYAIFYDTDTAEKALFSMPNGGSWTEVTDPVFEGSFEYVKSANGYILVSTRIDSNDAKLYYFDGGGFTEVAGIDMTGSTFHVIYDSTDFWISNDNILYQGDITLGTMTTALTLDSTVEIKGLSESASGAYIYLSCWDRENRDGYLMATDGNNGTLDEESDDKKTYKLFNLTAFRAEGYDFLLCGTNGLGYRQILSPSSSNLDLDTPDDDVLSENYTSAIELQNCAVIDFFVDGDPDGDLYALTATTGLWKNSLSGGTRVWSIE